MFMLPRRIALLLCTLCLVAYAAGGGKSAHAQIVRGNYTGVITSVDDSFNIFNNTIAVGGSVTGSFQYVPAQFQIFGSSATSTFYISAGFSNNSLLSANIGGVNLTTFPSPLLNVDVTNNSPGIGDIYRLFCSIDFPTEYNLADPDFIDFETYYPDLSISLSDPTGLALSSLNLPLSVPNFADFASGEGVLNVSFADLNTGEELVSTARFRLTSVTPSVAPEPGSCALLAFGGIGALLLRRRRCTVCR